jgi:hypothetical protein
VKQDLSLVHWNKSNSKHTVTAMLSMKLWRSSSNKTPNCRPETKIWSLDLSEWVRIIQLKLGFYEQSDDFRYIVKLQILGICDRKGPINERVQNEELLVIYNCHHRGCSRGSYSESHWYWLSIWVPSSSFWALGLIQLSRFLLNKTTRFFEPEVDNPRCLYNLI